MGSLSPSAPCVAVYTWIDPRYQAKYCALSCIVQPGRSVASYMPSAVTLSRYNTLVSKPPTADPGASSSHLPRRRRRHKSGSATTSGSLVERLNLSRDDGDASPGSGEEGLDSREPDSARDDSLLAGQAQEVRAQSVYTCIHALTLFGGHHPSWSGVER